MNIVVAITVPFLFVAANEKEDYLRKLYQHLIESKSGIAFVPPVNTENGSIDVEIRFSVSHIHTMDEITGSLIVNAELDMVWTDLRLQWDENEFGSLQEIYIPAAKIWKPDVTLQNSATAHEMFPFQHTQVCVSSSGVAMWFMPVTFHSTCPVDRRWFPYENYICPIYLASWSYTALEMKLELFHEHITSKPLELLLFYENPQWELMQVTVETQQTCFPGRTYNSSTILYKLNIRRHDRNFITEIIVPLGCAWLLTLSVVWFQPPAHLQLPIGAFTTFVTFHTLIFLGWIINPMGPNTPKIVIFCSCSFLMTVLSLILSICLTARQRLMNCGPLRKICDTVIHGRFQMLLCLHGNMSADGRLIQLAVGRTCFFVYFAILIVVLLSCFA